MTRSLHADIKQLFAKCELSRLDRLQDANIRFDYSDVDIYLSAYHRGFKLISQEDFLETNSNLVSLAQALSRFVYFANPAIDPETCSIISASFFWLAGYSANAHVISQILSTRNDRGPAFSSLLGIFTRRFDRFFDSDESIPLEIGTYLQTGSNEHLGFAISQCRELAQDQIAAGDRSGLVATKLLIAVLTRLRDISFWSTIQEHASAPTQAWSEYIEDYHKRNICIVDLWPSQRKAARSGLLDGTSTLVLQMPTSSGKTKMTELAFFNDLSSDTSNKCLYIAPFKALVSEVERAIGPTLSRLGYSVASLYGGSEADEIEISLSAAARVLVSTPEKIASVLRTSGRPLSYYKTVVIDEGHLIGDRSRGASFELQMASIWPHLSDTCRILFLSAVLPNADAIAQWLGRSSNALINEEWRPTSLRVGVVSWPVGQQARLDFVGEGSDTFIDRFCVPRILEETVSEYQDKNTRRRRTYRFPNRKEPGSVATALALKYCAFGPVLIYTANPGLAVSVASKINAHLIFRKASVSQMTEAIQEEILVLYRYCCKILGDSSILSNAILRGFAFHHGGMPQCLRLVVEDAYRSGTIQLLIATNTLAQGVNLPTKTVVVHTLPTSDNAIRDFWNLAGRSGRALQETEGDVIVVNTGTISQFRLRKFLDSRNQEPANSRILSLVIKILAQYPIVDADAIARVLADDQEEGWQQCIDAIDVSLVEVMAEDLTAEEFDPNVNALSESLFAFHQAQVLEEESRDRAIIGIRDLLLSRRKHLIEMLGTGSQQKRFIRLGLSIQSCMTLEESLLQVMQICQNHQELSNESFVELVHIACSTGELSGYNADMVANVATMWINGADYTSILEAPSTTFKTLDDTVKFVEDAVCYRLSWVLSGIPHLIKNSFPTFSIPGWISQLPNFVRHGTQSIPVTRILSLGIQDRRFGEFLLSQFTRTYGRSPRSLSEFLRFSKTNRESLISRMRGQWPNFHHTLMQGIWERYENVDEILYGL